MIKVLLRSMVTNAEAISLALIVGKSVNGRIKDLWDPTKTVLQQRNNRKLNKIHMLLFHGGRISLTNELASALSSSIIVHFPRSIHRSSLKSKTGEG
jgi:hypothetical protein